MAAALHGTSRPHGNALAGVSADAHAPGDDNGCLALNHFRKPR